MRFDFSSGRVIIAWLMCMSTIVSYSAAFRNNAEVVEDEARPHERATVVKNKEKMQGTPSKLMQTRSSSMPVKRPSTKFEDKLKSSDLNDVSHRNLQLQTIPQQFVMQYSGKCIEVAGASMNRSAKIEQADCVPGATNQMFEKIGFSTRPGFMLKSAHSGMCISVPGGSRQSDIQLTQWDCTSSSSNQILDWVGTSLIFEFSLMCLSIDQDSMVSGTAIVQKACAYNAYDAINVTNTIVNIPAASAAPTPSPSPVPLRTDASNQYVVKKSGLCMEVYGASQVNGGTIRQSLCSSGAAHQIFKTVQVSGGFMLKASHSGKCITVPGANQDGGIQLKQNDCLELPNQILNWSGSSLQLQHSGKCLNIDKWKAVVQETCANLLREQFTLASAVSYQPFVALHSRKCMDIADESLLDGAYVVQWDCAPGKPSQQFEEVLGTAGFMIKNKLSGKCVTLYGHFFGGSLAEGMQFGQHDCTNAPNQVFTRNIGELIVGHSNLCIEVEYGSIENGARIIQSRCHGFHNQIFSYVPYVVGHSNMCLDVADKSTDNHGIVVQADCVTGGNSQKLRMIPGADGGFQLKFLHSGKCIGISGSSTDENAKVVQWDCIDGLQDQLLNWKGTSLVFKHSGMCLNVFFANEQSTNTLTQHNCIEGAPNEQFYSAKPTPLVTFSSVGIIARHVKFERTRHSFSLGELELTQMNFLHRFPAYVSQLSNGLIALETTAIIHEVDIATGLNNLTFHTELPPGSGTQYSPQSTYDTVHMMTRHPQQKGAAYWAPRQWDGFYIASTANKGISSIDDEHAMLSQWTQVWLRVINEYFYRWIHDVESIDFDAAVALNRTEAPPPEFKNSEEVLSNLLLGRLPKPEGGFYGLGRDVFSKYGSLREYLKATHF